MGDNMAMAAARCTRDTERMTTPPTAAHRVTLVPASGLPRHPSAPKVRRYRLARLRAGSRAPEAPRYAYLKKLYD
jgi:hypothetical protein